VTRYSKQRFLYIIRTFQHSRNVTMGLNMFV